VHAQLDAQHLAVGPRRRDAQQLDAVAQLLGVADVGGLQRGDALDVRLVELHRDAEGDGDDMMVALCAGVDPFDVEGRVGLGITQAPGPRLSAASKSRPLSRISLRMKFVVPLMMPAIQSMRLAVRPSRSALMMGMPPATAASKATITPLARQRRRSRCRARPAAPCWR
jgi:hypothetical protein